MAAHAAEATVYGGHTLANSNVIEHLDVFEGGAPPALPGPTLEELVYWLIHPAEIDRRVRGAELETMIAADAPAQRRSVLASQAMIADPLKLLPKENEVKGRFSTMSWARQRKGPRMA